MSQYLDYGHPLVIHPYVLEGILRPSGFIEKINVAISAKNDI